MKYYKYNSIPLEEITELTVGDRAFDEYGNYIEVNAFKWPEIIVKSVLNDGETLNNLRKPDVFLRSFWFQTKNNLIENGIEI